jgi:hypothetical protein
MKEETIMNGKNMYQMDESELEALIRDKEQTVAKLNYERPGSVTAHVEAGVLKDAKELLGGQRKKRQRSEGPSFRTEDTILDEPGK